MSESGRCGARSGDEERFGPVLLPALREATADFSFLLTRGYAPGASLKLVGDRFQFDARQRDAIRRSACSDEALAGRAARRIVPEAVAGGALRIDGFNLLVTVEAALARAHIFRGRDGCLRDLPSVRGLREDLRLEARVRFEPPGEQYAGLGLRSGSWRVGDNVRIGITGRSPASPYRRCTTFSFQRGLVWPTPIWRKK